MYENQPTKAHFIHVSTLFNQTHSALSAAILDLSILSQSADLDLAPSVPLKDCHKLIRFTIA